MFWLDKWVFSLTVIFNDVNLTKFDLYEHSYCVSPITMMIFVIVTLITTNLLEVLLHFDHI